MDAVVRLQRHKYDAAGKERFQYRITIPSRIIEKMFWRTGGMIEMTILDDTLVCRVTDR